MFKKLKKKFWPRKHKKLTSKVAYLWQFWFFLCSPECPKQPRIEYLFYGFLYPMISGNISWDHYLTPPLSSKFSDPPTALFSLLFSQPYAIGKAHFATPWSTRVKRGIDTIWKNYCCSFCVGHVTWRTQRFESEIYGRV